LLTLIGACTIVPSACSHLTLLSRFEMCEIPIEDNKKRSREMEVMDVLKVVLNGEVADKDLLPELFKMNKHKLIKDSLTLIP
jgi:TusA-related sulfurtransferase